MKLGFIGTGNMASAIMGGIIKNNVIPAEEIIGADLFAPGRERAQKEYGINVTADNKEVASKAETIILSVKPQFYASVIADIKDVVTDNQIIITIAPGKTLAWLAEQFGKEVKIVRTMPNTPAMVGEGMTAVCPNEHLTEDEIAYVKSLLESFSRAEIVPERLMDVVTAVSGSSPAYVFMLIEAMADAAVSGGMPRKQAYQFAAQAVLGSAKMVLDTGKHPGELKDMVCSPAGTTIEAVRTLEELGFRSSIIEAMKVCEEMGLDRDTYSVTIPLGATINMDGAAITITVMTMATAFTLGINVDIPTAIILSLLAALSACGASGVAGGSLLLIPLACSLFGISDDIAMQVVAVGFIIGVIQDSVETALNSSSDLLLSASAEFRQWRLEGKEIKFK